MEILGNVVSLNAQRSAEERSGVIRLADAIGRLQDRGAEYSSLVYYRDNGEDACCGGWTVVA